MKVTKRTQFLGEDKLSGSLLAKTEPVVGWLVCISGIYYGESFLLKEGMNTIGRASYMDVVLGADTSVTRDRHAVILYRPEDRTFLLQPGMSPNAIYLNGKPVNQTVLLKSYDVLLFGKTQMLFYPLCGERFHWDMVKNK